MKKFFLFFFPKHKDRGGYTMLETVVYVGVLSVVVIAVFTILFSITRAFTNARIYSEMEVSGTTAMERMAREIRTAVSVDEGNSILDDANGDGHGQLQLNTTDDAGSAKTVQFYFDAANKTVNLVDNAIDKGALTGDGVEVTNLVFRKWDTTKSSLVKIEMTIKSKKKATTTAEFYDSVVLRGGY